ncbi:hypothetical protein [Pantoea sp. ME81]|uniref:hypothetical protein n=1 Tax=Pantoea sp. ME81 TaxID=2743935 RepID=UPI0015F474C2|nr:hypothetical protein [Pantoea sp. ME81]
MVIIGRFILQVLLQVLIKLVITMFSKEMIGKMMFACLHRLVKITKTTKDDELLEKLERLYWGISDNTDQQSEYLLHKLRGNDDHT